MVGRGPWGVLLIWSALSSAALAQPLPPEPPSDLLPPPAPDYVAPVRKEGPSRSRPSDRPSLLGAPLEAERHDLPPEPAPGEDLRRTHRRNDLPLPPEEPGSRARQAQAEPAEEQPSVNLPRGAVIGRPINDTGEIQPVSARTVEQTLQQARSASATERVVDPMDDFLRHRERRAMDTDDASPRRRAYQFGDRVRDFADSILGPQADWFRSDHAYDCYISPITNPFLFEDPRSLTEVRPIFLYQQIPNKQPDFQGGNIIFFGTQARLAITERWSVVMHKLGGISVNPKSPLYPDATGFAEIWLGPKYTFYRDDIDGALAAGGLQFQIPAGNSSVYQDTGNLSIVPYITYAHPFFRDSQFGTLNTMVGTGYAFSTNRQRSDYYYLSAHADLNVANWNRFFPMMELNWLINTTNGTSQPFQSEGRDLINFGSQASGVGQLTWAVGGRVKMTESAQLGFAYEMPIAGPKEFFLYRFTIDFILRY